MFKKKGRKNIPVVKSGIALSGFFGAAKQDDAQKEVVTSRFVRVLLAGAGFLADAYDLFVINLVLRLLKDDYPEYALNGQRQFLEGSVAAAALIGSVIGQVVAGSMADIIGRKKIFVATAVLITLGSLGSAICVDTSALSVYIQISFWRFFLGLGVGGEYPLAATVTSESSSAKRRGSLMAAVFSMQGVGALTSMVVVLICLSAGASNNFTWRFALAFGSMPAMVAFPFRLQMHETETFERVKQEREKMNQMKNTPTHPIASINQSESSSSFTIGGSPIRHSDSHLYQAVSTSDHPGPVGLLETNPVHEAVDSSGTPGTKKKMKGILKNSNTSLDNIGGITHAQEHQTHINSHYGELTKAFRFYKWHMLGTASCWFLLDVVFYANGLFNHDVVAKILSTKDGVVSTPWEDAAHSAVLGIIAIPGYVLSVLFIDRVGRKNIQLMGFTVMGILYFICGFCYSWLLDPEGETYRKYLFMLIYSLTFLFSNFGPNTTSFVIPGEIYPTEVRATCHGLSAAAGKIGAATGAYLFPIVLDGGIAHSGAVVTTNEGIKAAMFLSAIIAWLGTVMTLLFIPRYNAEILEKEGTYLPLEYTCLQPTMEQMMSLDGQLHLAGTRSASSFGSMGDISEEEGNMEMMQVVMKTDDYDLSSGKSKNGKRKTGKKYEKVQQIDALNNA